jgi:hypothetical protein
MQCLSSVERWCPLAFGRSADVHHDYTDEQSNEKCLQALTELLQLPSVVLKFMQQQQLASEGVIWAIDSSRPGHCIWQLKKLLGCSAPAPAAPATVDIDGPPMAHWECVSLPYTSFLASEQCDATFCDVNDNIISR